MIGSVVSMDGWDSELPCDWTIGRAGQVEAVSKLKVDELRRRDEARISVCLVPDKLVVSAVNRPFKPQFGI